MATKHFVIRQDSLKILSIEPASTQFLGIDPNGVVVTTGIPSGNFDNYTLLTTTENISADLQGQIDALTAASSGGIGSINSVTNPGGNIDLITNTSEVSITPDDGNNEIAIDVDLTAYALTADITGTYATKVEVENVSGNLQQQIDNIEQESTIIIGGDGISAVEAPANTYTISVSGDYITRTEVANVTAQLQADIDTNTSNIQQNANDIAAVEIDVTNLRTDVDEISANYATKVEVENVSGNLQSQIDAIVPESTTIASSGGSITVSQNGYHFNLEVATSPIQNHNDLNGLQGGNGSDEYYHLTAAQFSDYIGATEVSSISAGLDARISQNESDITDIEAELATLDTRFVNVSGDTMTGDLTVPNLTVTNDVEVQNDMVVQNNFYVNGEEFIVATTSVSAEDNIIYINVGEVGPGVTAGYSGIRVDRGSADDYFLVFDDNRDAFAVGVATDESSGALSQTQLVATREDSPLNNGYAIWNDSLKRFDTVPLSTISAGLTGDFVQKTGDTMTGDLTMSNANIDIDGGVLTIDDSTQAYAENLDADIGTEIVDQFSATLGYSAQWIVSIRNGTTDLRTSVVAAVWDGTSDVEFYETSTKDIGNTKNVDLDVVLTGGNVQLRAIVGASAGNDWIIKAHRIVI